MIQQPGYFYKVLKQFKVKALLYAVKAKRLYFLFSFAFIRHSFDSVYDYHAAFIAINCCVLTCCSQLLLAIFLMVVKLVYIYYIPCCTLKAVCQTHSKFHLFFLLGWQSCTLKFSTATTYETHFKFFFRLLILSTFYHFLDLIWKQPFLSIRYLLLDYLITMLYYYLCIILDL